MRALFTKVKFDRPYIVWKETTFIVTITSKANTSPLAIKIEDFLIDKLHSNTVKEKILFPKSMEEEWKQ